MGMKTMHGVGCSGCTRCVRTPSDGARVSRRLEQMTQGTVLLCVILGMLGVARAQPAGPPYQVYESHVDAPMASDPGPFVTIGARTFFAASEQSLGRELWVTDGTAAGTVLVKDIDPGIASADPHFLTAVDGTLFFAARDGAHGTTLWKSDGTATGTIEVSRFDLQYNNNCDPSAGFRSVNGMLLFAADDPAHGQELWRSDGTSTGTALLKDINPGPGPSLDCLRDAVTSVDGSLFFTAGGGVWRSDGTTD